ncbi:hypothetical protein [Clostridium butyricum]|uniref:hypothetical protein n=1 Tax=Clostridium butyricum TaxID=1492 RepID=UPI0032C060AF
MSNAKIFNINEIITIVMEEVRIEENRQMYGIDEESDLPKGICNKLDSLKEIEFKEFLNIIEEITNEILYIKSGELNELNKCHEEIIYMAQEKLDDYIIS